MYVLETELSFPEPLDTGVSFGGSHPLFLNAVESFGVSLSPQEDYGWLKGWSRVGYLLDSIADINEDFQNGSSAVKPTWFARKMFMKATSKESVVALGKTPPKLLGKCMLTGLNYIIKQKKVAVG